MNPTMEILLALGIYLNFKIWFLFIIHRLTSPKEEHQSTEKGEAILESPGGSAPYTLGMMVASILLIVGGIMSFLEVRFLEVGGVFLYVGATLPFMVCAFQYCLRKAFQPNKLRIDPYFLRLSELGAILLLISGSVIGVLYNLKFIPFNLILTLNLSFLIRLLSKYFSD